MHKQMMVGLQFLGYMGKWIHHQKIMELSETIRVKTLAAEATFQEELSMAETHYEKMQAYDHRRVAMLQAVNEYRIGSAEAQKELDTRVC